MVKSVSFEQKSVTSLLALYVSRFGGVDSTDLNGYRRT